MPSATKDSNHIEPSRGFKAKLGTSKIVSYEDLLIAQYIDDIKRTRDVGNRSSGSPYLGRYQSLEEGLSKNNMTFRQSSNQLDRPISAQPYRKKKGHEDNQLYLRPASAVQPNRKPKIDAKFIADPEMWDPETPRDDPSKNRKITSFRSRSESAPMISATVKSNYSDMIDHEIYLSKRPKKKKPLYKRQPYVIRCTAYKNGDRSIFAYVAAPNVKQLLEACTTKLQLNGAARRIFLEDGTEIFETDEIQKDGEIYVTNGEAFKNPYKTIIETHEQKEQLKWTLSGVTLPPRGTSKKRKSKFLLSKRFKNLIAVNKRRIMIYLNGQHTNCHEVITDMKSIDDFLTDVTNKLALRRHARVLYDWNGKEITGFDQIPVMDSCLQETGTPVLGPLWVSCGGGFSPTGASNFLKDILSHLKKRVKQAKYHQTQLNYAKNGEDGRIEIVSILSMTEDEVNSNLKLVDKDISTVSETIKKMEEIYKTVKSDSQLEQDSGYSYTLQHIKEINVDDPSVGGTGLRLKVYRNGEYGKPSIVYFNAHKASRGVKDGKLVFERLLDQCLGRVGTSLANSNKFAKRLFNLNGDEITEMKDLQNDQEVFVSMGESFKLPYIPCLQIYFEQVRGVEKQFPEDTPLQKIAVFNQSAVYLETNKSDYEGSIGFPADYKWISCTDKTEPEVREEILESKQLDINTHWLIHKEKRDIVLNPALVIAERKKKGSNDLWPADCQQWVLSQDGYICSHSMSYLVISVLETNVECNTKTKSSVAVSGFAIGMQKRQEGNPAQQWRFTTSGLIYSVSHPDLYLTFLGARVDQSDDEKIENKAAGTPNGFIPYLAVCEKISGKDSSLQRFALKQERFENIGQWKHNDRSLVTNNDYNKLAYSWPVDAHGEWNNKFDWPMEFFFIAKAPPISRSKKETSGHVPLRLTVMKNGESDPIHSSPVVGPDLTNMMKDLSKHEKSAHSHHHHSHSGTKKSVKRNEDHDDSVSDFPLHCDDLTFRELEFRLFLERCTGALNLPFAARRLFDDEGREHHSLKELNRDQLVYVTCGEIWIDPRVSKAESQRRLLLTNLAADIAQIQQFCALRDTEGYVIEVEGAAAPNAKIVVNYSPEVREKIESEMDEIENQERQETQEQIEADLELANTTAHERSHQKLDERQDKLKWPWERIANDELSDLQESPRISQPEMPRTKMSKQTRNDAQKFSYDDGYIYCHCDPNLVIGVVSAGEGNNAEVALVKKKLEEPSQKWIVGPNGYIQSKAHRDMVLTVAMPTNQRRDEEGLMLNYAGCQVVLQKKKSSQFGSANQKWSFDQESRFIWAFHTNHLDAEVAAANKSNVCTYAVTKDVLDQPGYMADIPSKDGRPKEIVVCTSCARAMRGRFKLTKLPNNYDFSCAMGTTKLKELKNIGSFRCLNGKVDLSTFEAINTLDEWETKYSTLHEESSVRTIAKQISAAEQPQTVKIYAYRNGEGRKTEGQLITGSSIIGLLDQCTYRLGMNNAARRLYARDGEIMLGIDDLIGWAVDHYVGKTSKKQNNGYEGGLVGLKEAPIAVSEDSVDTLQYQSIIVTTDKGGEGYRPVNEEPLELDHVLFDVTTDFDGHIALIQHSESQSDMVFEIIIGRKSESAIIVHPPADNRSSMNSQDTLDIARFPAMPAAEATRETFWLGWSDSTIRVGKGINYGENEIISKPSQGLRPVNMVVVATPEGVTTWTFYLPVTGSTVNSNASGPTDLHKLINKVELNDDDDEEDTGSKKDSTELPPSSAKNVLRPKTAVRKKTEAPPVETILRYPIEVWASAGEAFIKLEKVASDQKEMRHYRKLVADISYELEKEKHRLRQLQGRRLMEQNPGHYEATGSAVVPVVRKNHWQELTYSEAIVHDEVHHLQNKQSALRAKQRSSTFRPRPGSRLYAQPKMIRVLAYANGEPIARAQYVWGSDMEQILQNATTRLNLRRAAKSLFNLNGHQLTFDELEKDQIVCISTGNQFQRPRDAQQDVEIRANWTRARKQHGPEATDIRISAKLNPDIDVDPFGPPSLAATTIRDKAEQE